MTNVLQAVKTSLVGKTVAVSALAVVGAAGLGAGSAGAAPASSGYDTVGISNKSNSSINANANSGSRTSADYTEYTKYIYYENMVKASFDTSEFKNQSLNARQSDEADFFRNSAFMNEYNDWKKHNVKHY